MSQTLDNLSYTWNNAGTTFTGIKYNVLDTASASGSLLMDLQVGGVSKFKVDKGGAITIANGLTLSNYFSYLKFSGNFMANNLRTDGEIWIGSAEDVRLYRDAANTLAQRNSTNAQTFRCYGTYTDGSNYRRLTQTMSTGGVAEIKPEGAGTGASGNVLHISGLPTSNPGAGILWNDAGTVKVGT